MNNFERMYTSLAEEADSILMPDPGVLRRRADRRSRVRLAVGTAAVAVLVGATIAGGQVVFRADHSPLPPGGTPSPSVVPAPSTVSPSATPPATATSSTPPSGDASPPSPQDPTPTTPKVPTSIPASAFLQLADTNGDERPTERSSENMLPPLCGADHPSDNLIGVRRTMHVTYWKQRAPGQTPDGTFDQTITAYRSDGAHRFMTQLRAAVTDCPTEKRGSVTHRNKLVSGPSYGDESIRFEVRYPTIDVNGDPTGGQDLRLISVVRVDNVVMVLYEQGWEAGWSAEPAVVDTFTETALTRLEAWLD